jgi:hypothetical protein
MSFYKQWVLGKKRKASRGDEEFDLPSPISATHVPRENIVNEYTIKSPLDKGSLDDVTKIGLAVTESKGIPNNTAETEITNQSYLTVLISNGVADYKQAAAQKSTLQHLDDFRLPYQTIDGMDTSQHVKRNELFGISGIRGNYPQLFGWENDQYTYLGGYSWLQEQTMEELINICGGQKN